MRKNLFKKWRIYSLLLLVAFSFVMFRTHTFIVNAEETSGTGSNFEDSFAKMSFYDLYEDGVLQVSEQAKAKTYSKLIGTNIWGEVIELEDPDFGVIVSAEAENVADAEVTFAKKFDFGTDKIDRLTINALGKRASITKVQVYVNGSVEPGCSVKLPNQKRDGDWTKNKEINIDLSKAEITGECEIAFKFTTSKTEEGNNEDLATMLRYFQFVPQSIPVLTLDIDETESTIADMHNDPTHDTECYGKVNIRVPEGYKMPYESTDGAAFTGGTFDLDYIRGRGNSTWDVDKKPYKIKFDKSVDLFNMGKSKHWVLLANHFDNSFVRNRMTYWITDQLRDMENGGIEYSPKCVNVDLIMNGEYLGNYLLCEQIRVDKNRLNIKDIAKAYEETTNPESVDLSGGYWLSMAPYGDESGYGFVSKTGIKFYINSPESVYDTPLNMRMDFSDTDEGEGPIGDTAGNLGEKPEYGEDVQYEEANKYIKSYIQRVEDAIFGEGFKNKDGESYADLMDVDSAVAYYWMQEFSQNADAFETSSTYLYKKADKKDADGNVIEQGKLYWGPLWDFDYVAWSSRNYDDCAENENAYAGFEWQKSWFERLMKDPTFAAKVKDYWKENFKPTIEKVIAEGGLLDQYRDELSVSANNDRAKWGPTVFDGGQEELIESLSYADEIERLRTWITYRTKWVDENIENVLPKQYTIKFMDGDEVFYEGIGYEGRYFMDVPVETPTMEGYLFSGWYLDSTHEVEGEIYTEEQKIEYYYYVDAKDSNEDGEIIIKAKYVSENDIVFADEVLFENKNYVMRYDDEVKDAFNLCYTLLPKETTMEGLDWISSDESVATVYEGYVAATGVGETTITAVTKSGKKYSVPVQVIAEDSVDDYILSGLSMSEKAVDLKVGEGHKLYAETNPTKAYYIDRSEKLCMWISTDENVVTIDDCGYVKAIGPGEATIVALNTERGISCTCKVKVTGEKELTVGDKFAVGNLKYAVTSINGNDLQVKVIGKVKTAKKITIPATVIFANKTFKVTEIEKAAFAKNKKLKELVIGSNVTTIGSKAFYKCSKLSKIKVSSKSLKAVGKKAFGGISKKVKIKASKSVKKKIKRRK